MKLHLPTALRRALLAITALLSPAVVTTTIATATLAAITAPAMADDLTLNADSNAFATDLTVEKLNLASGVTSATLEPDKSTTLTVTADSICLASDQTLKLINTKIIANQGIETLLTNVAGKDCIRMNTSSIWGSGGSSAHDVLLSSFIKDKLDTVTQAYVYITKGHILFDVGIDDDMSCCLGDGKSEDSGSVSATISSELDSLKIVNVASDATLDLGGGSKGFTLNIYELRGTVKTGRDLTLTGNRGWGSDACIIYSSSSVCVEENSEASITLDKVELMGGSVSAHNIILKDVTAYNNYKSTLTATNELQIQGNIELKNTIVHAGSTIIADGQSLTLGTGKFTTGDVTIGEGATLDLGSSTTNLKGIITNNGTLVLGGTITVDDTAFTAGTRERYSAGDNGYKITDTTYTVLTGDGAVTGTATWKVGTQSATYEDGMVIVAGIGDTAVYYVRNGDVAYTRALANGTTTFRLDGGHLELNESLKDTQSIEWKSTASWLNINNAAVELKSSQLSTVSAGNFTLIAPNGGTYIIDKKVGDIVELTLGTGVTLSDEHWWGTVKTAGDTTVSSNLDTTSWKNTELNGTTTVNSGVTLTLGGNTTLGGKITNGGTLNLQGSIMVDTTTFNPSDAVKEVTGYFIGNSTTPNSTKSGFEAAYWDITIAEGGTIDGTGATWKLKGDDDATFDFESDGTLHAYGSSVDTIFHVAQGDTITYSDRTLTHFTNSEREAATSIQLDGGTLKLEKNLGTTSDNFVKAATASKVEISNGVTLNAAQLDASAADVTLRGSGSYDLQGQELSGTLQLGAGVLLDGNEWKGTVYTGSTKRGAALVITALGNSQSTVYLGDQPMPRSTPVETVLESLTAAGVGTTIVPGSLTLKSESTADALVVKGILTLSSADAVASPVASLVASLVAVSVDAQALNVQLTDEVLSNKDAGDTLELVKLEKKFEGALTFNGSSEIERVRSEDNRKEYTLAWNEAGTVLTLTILGTQTYVAEQVKPTTHNGKAGVALMTDVFLNSRPQKDAPDGALAGILNAVDAGTATDRDMAAVAGASTAALGMALSGDVERQLRAIRNRSLAGNDAATTTLVDEKSGMVSMEAPARFFAWVNAEGNRAEQNADSTAAGYTLTSWGGTLGAGMQVNDKLTLGLALTAMYGNLQSDSPDYLKGDMDTTYVSVFARYESGKWSHAFIGTAGTMEADYKRSVSHAAGSYSTNGNTDGTDTGLMYEVSREFALGNRSTLSPVLNIAYRHTEVDSYSESGADAALNVGKQSMDTVTLGAGARYAAVVGQQILNRACGFEARALVKYDLGDRQSTTSTGFTGYATRDGIESAELGAFGVELGAGISVPAGSGRIFADGAVELKSDYTNFNAAVGYRVQF